MLNKSRGIVYPVSRIILNGVYISSSIFVSWSHVLNQLPTRLFVMDNLAKLQNPLFIECYTLSLFVLNILLKRI
ncbi:hypothetical protein BDF20DRAFT_852016 [Mycotypha africana]|uniref:uncharacterized protein n=1 Tax=Mycotypha africana TaxID=64632 RepID=UPI002300165E|nr:uncharacterized protein BDF20DRAFT_852016 [Mycotypha africana]KAI8987750.1 hypothetical protein BDF20DRAFT_852016 [Mycotypha africana]